MLVISIVLCVDLYNLLVHLEALNLSCKYHHVDRVRIISLDITCHSHLVERSSGRYFSRNIYSGSDKVNITIVSTVITANDKKKYFTPKDSNGNKLFHVLN